MASEPHPIFTPNLIVGLSVTAVGVVLALDQLQMADARQLFRYWPLAVILFGASMVVQSLQGGDLAEPGRKVRGYGAPRMFLLLLILIVVSQAFQRERGTDRAVGSDKVTLIAVMSQDNRVSTSTRFRGGEMTSFMGECRLDLRQATILPGEEAVIDVFALMGGLTLQIPEGWTVDVQVIPVMGGVQDRRGLPDAPDRRSRRGRTSAEAEQGSATARGEPSSSAATTPTSETQTPAEVPTASAAPVTDATRGGTAPRLVLRGVVTMSGLTIRS
jgi:hypothetical protein